MANQHKHYSVQPLKRRSGQTDSWIRVFAVLQGSRRVYELEVRNQAEALEKQLRRGTYRDSLVHSQT